MTTETEVVFTAKPVVGERARIVLRGQHGLTSAVTRVREDPPTFHIQTASGSYYAGKLVTYMGGSPTGPSPAQRQPTSSSGSTRPHQSATPSSHPGLQWIGVGSRITIGKYLLADPMVYCSTGKAPVSDASCIDYRLAIGQPSSGTERELGYWPCYSDLSPSQRANYLSWLAGGRNAPLREIGYAFLFFYGLERRLLIDLSDVRPIANEVIGLLKLYTSSGSFNTYLSSFLAYAIARGGVQRLDQGWFQTLAELFFRIGGEPLSVALAWLYTHEQPLPAHLAYLLAFHDARFSRSVVIDRLTDQFKQLFMRKYRDTFGSGLMLKCAKRPLRFIYHPASPSLVTLHGTPKIPPVDIPDVLGIGSQFAKVADIWTQCIEELKPLSRKLAKGVEADTREAYEALPPELRAEIDHPDKANWERSLVGNVRENGIGLLRVGDLARIQRYEERTRLTAKQSESLAATAFDVGLVVVPDARITGRAYSWTEPIALFRPEGAPSLPKDKHYSSAAVMLELGMAMAAADGKVESDEVDHITQVLEEDFNLDPIDAQRLEAYKLVLTTLPPSIKSTVARLKTGLSTEQRASVGRFLVGVAGANGSISKDEISDLKKAYTLLEVDHKELIHILDELSSRDGEPVEIQGQISPSRPGEAIPLREGREPEPVVTINDDVLRRILSDTEEVSRMLSEVLQSGDEGMLEPAEVESFSAPSPAATAVLERVQTLQADVLPGLDTRYHALVHELASQGNWSKSEFDSVVRMHGFMPAGALDVINTWSDEYLGDFLIEEGSTYSINTHLLEAR